ncbi:DUF1077-domain-containing protein [Basidiobolus meristosporus CBS 931.73]|uniref:ER membrane protein complex subunit 4 n=1 Tax=Basidiobolus meristosporus CBS 931.73 TaxID=1314790 RepID=A0A1Y1Z7A7_9FUNG|nr:DUF1077-domain-containing protein [Basidiobolus meristosporus CBS 931.73]|eukprot:ORY06096.1 DUF1077-domain-containing protein [Basidiobolus meristosporus CBS 931.73]
MSRNISKWTLDFSSLDQSRTRKNEQLDPPGFVLASTGSSRNSNKNVKQVDAGASANLKLKKAWEASLAPAKNIPMNAFMLYMSGSGVQIFSIIITGMLFFQPFQALMNLNSVFDRFAGKTSKGKNHSADENVDLTLPKLVYVAVQVAIMCMGVYKLSSMGLLPTASSDWLAFMDPKQMLELTP